MCYSGFLSFNCKRIKSDSAGMTFGFLKVANKVSGPVML